MQDALTVVVLAGIVAAVLLFVLRYGQMRLARARVRGEHPAIVWIYPQGSPYGGVQRVVLLGGCEHS